MKYEHVLAYVSDTIWSIEASKLRMICAVLASRVAGEEIDAEAIEAVVAASRRPEPPRSGAAVAVIPIYGVIGHRAASMSKASGGTSTEALTQVFRQAMADPSVSAIALDIDSPGGTVPGVPELADEMYRARGRKPVVAVANSLAASAAYWLAAQADELVALPSAQVGSVGVMTSHVDVSEALAQKGIRVTYLTSARFKAEGAPEQPLSAEAIAHYQSQIDHYHGLFTRAIARGRGVPVADARGERFGEGRVYNAQEALSRGMIDRIGTLESVVARLSSGQWERPMRAEAPSLDVAEIPDAALDRIRAAAETVEIAYTVDKPGFRLKAEPIDPEWAARRRRFALRS